ncbi:hypothetical protein GCM10009133_33470 [Cocleimonas flava]|uniref:Uncharacterized protein n=1 Tax=Cocleimonas flava TaxID=634765 RepID=A0A4R1FA81_9GAMM|nr:hypothetical protein [Cocleimonas flava]TCJ88808.1 hypothetical protein EV695_0667 [Cocleimonas flava]
MNVKHYAGAKDRSFKTSTLTLSMKLLSIASLSILTIACSSSSSSFDSPELLPADSMMQGPGLFSGNKGSYDALEAKKPSSVVEARSSSTSTMPSLLAGKDLQQTSALLEEKIKQSQRNTIELDLLKRQVDEKLRAN